MSAKHSSAKMPATLPLYPQAQGLSCRARACCYRVGWKVVMAMGCGPIWAGWCWRNTHIVLRRQRGQRAKRMHAMCVACRKSREATAARHITAACDVICDSSRGRSGTAAREPSRAHTRDTCTSACTSAMPHPHIYIQMLSYTSPRTTLGAMLGSHSSATTEVRASALLPYSMQSVRFRVAGSP